MRKKILIGLGIVFAVGIFVGILTFTSQKRQTTTAAAAYANLKGNYFLLHFWAKWCEPCVDEIPLLVEFSKHTDFDKPLYVLAVSLDPTLEDAKQILPGNGASLPAHFILTLDPQHQFAESMGSYQYPYTYLIGPDGNVLEKWVGSQKWNKPEVLEYFKKRVH